MNETPNQAEIEVSVRLLDQKVIGAKSIVDTEGRQIVIESVSAELAYRKRLAEIERQLESLHAEKELYKNRIVVETLRGIQVESEIIQLSTEVGTLKALALGRNSGMTASQAAGGIIGVTILRSLGSRR